MPDVPQEARRRTADALHHAVEMHVALTWLKEEKAPLGDLASRLSYQSEAAFSRAFKRFIGVSPGVVRRNGKQTEWEIP